MPRMAKEKSAIQKVPTEDAEQILLATWLDKQKIKYFAIPNGGYSLNLFQALKLKRMGLKSGVPDLCIPLASGIYHGLYIELKRQKGGKVSESQKEWIGYLSESGYFVSVCNGFEAAKAVVLHYLSLTRNAA